jgi:hypothetical protein
MIVTKFGYYNPFMFLGPACVAVAGGIWTTWDVHETNAMINGLQVLAGVGAANVIQTVRFQKLSHLPT